MTRAVVALALASGIPVAAWLREDDRVIETAFDLLQEQRHGGDHDGAMMSG